MGKNKSPFDKGGFRGNVNTDSRKKDSQFDYPFFCESAGARTRDPNIKSVVLYLLSYGFIVPNRSISVFGGANVGNIFIIAKFILILLHFFDTDTLFLSINIPIGRRTQSERFSYLTL